MMDNLWSFLIVCKCRIFHLFISINFLDILCETLHDINIEQRRAVSFVSVAPIVRTNFRDILKKYKMGNCLWKFANKPFTLHTAPLTSGQLKKVVSGIQ